MPVVERANGRLRVHVPATYRVSEQVPADATRPRPGAGRARAGRQRPTGPIPLPTAVPAVEGDELAAAFGRQELELVDQLVLEPAAAPGSSSGRRGPSTGGFAEAFLGVGAAAFVSSLWSVGDVPARTFTESLYAALLDGASVSEATSAARAKARAAGDATWLAYVVYAHPRARLTVER